MKWRRLPGPKPATIRVDRARFEAMVLPHLDSAHNFARWLVRDASLAEDVVQEAMLRSLRYFSSFRDGDPRAWLLRIVRNVAYGALTSRRRQTETALDDSPFAASPALSVPDPADDPEAALARRQDLERLEHALAGLNSELRECLVLRELEGLSYRQIAEITGAPIGTIMSRLWRARQTLISGSAEGRNDGG